MTETHDPKDPKDINVVEELGSIFSRASELRKTPTAFLTGVAGSGKTYNIIQAIDANPSFGMLCATTGIAGVNLGATTLNAVLGFFDTNSLRESYSEGWIHRRLRNIAGAFDWLVIDEVSMMSKQQLDIIVAAVNEVNEDRHESGKSLLGILLTGDFAQLSPIPGPLYDDNGREILQTTGRYKGQPKREPTPWAFHAEIWPEFEANTIKLTKVYRQTDPRFIDALNSIRRGAGNMGVSLLKQIVEFAPRQDLKFPGTTIVSKNDEVDRVNNLRLMDLSGPKHTLQSYRWWAGQVRGQKQPGEWNNIPLQQDIKEGALIMLLDNRREEPGSSELVYCNGDLAKVLEIQEEEGRVTGIHVALQRNDREVTIEPITRRIETRDDPHENHEDDELHPQIYESKTKTNKKCWVLGENTFFPLRLAYATTVHKSQGLSIDNVQIDPSNHFFGSPQMAYVALSRARTAGGLRIVGRPENLASKVKVDEAIRRFL